MEKNERNWLNKSNIKSYYKKTKMSELPEEVMIQIAEYHHEIMMNKVLNDLNYYWKDRYYMTFALRKHLIPEGNNMINEDIYTNKKLNLIISI
jgi:ubiquitin C-terminal hydrolase